MVRKNQKVYSYQSLPHRLPRSWSSAVCLRPRRKRVLDWWRWTGRSRCGSTAPSAPPRPPLRGLSPSAPTSVREMSIITQQWKYSFKTLFKATTWIINLWIMFSLWSLTLRSTSEPCVWIRQKKAPWRPTQASWPAVEGLNAASWSGPDTLTLDSSWKVLLLHRATAGSEKSPTGRESGVSRSRVTWLAMAETLS